MAKTQKQAIQFKVLSWPTPQEYNEAVQNASHSFADPDLKGGQPALTPMGLPRPISGAFASVYRMHCRTGDWAVRCFLYNIPDQTERYARISEHLGRVHLPYTVSFNFLDEGIMLHGQWYPIMKMQWADGQHLNEFVERNLTTPAVIKEFAEKWKVMINRLQASGVAHGDLQHGNVLVDNRDFKLVDYDGMFVPALAGKISNEIGHRNYQHPARSKDDFGLYLDNFAAWVVYVSLQCVSIDPELWTRLNGGDECLIFRQTDFTDPLNSTAFAMLEGHRDQEVRTLAKTLRYFLTLPVNMVPDLEHPPPEPTDLPPVHPPSHSHGFAQPGGFAGAAQGAGASFASPGGFPDWLASHTGQQSAPAQHGASGWGRGQGSAAQNPRGAGVGQAGSGGVSSRQTASHAVPPWWNKSQILVLALIGLYVLSIVFGGVKQVSRNPESVKETTRQEALTTGRPIDRALNAADFAIKDGDEFFANKQYEQAAAAYKEGLDKLNAIDVNGSQQTGAEVQKRRERLNTALASCYMHLGQYKEAEPHLQNAMVLDASLHGSNSKQVALDLSDLGTTAFRKGDYKKAGDYFDRALSIMQSAINPPDEHVATALRNRALVYQREKNYSKAEPLLKKALKIYDSSSAPDRDEQMKQLINDLGFNYQSSGNKSEAQKMRIWLKSLEKEKSVSVEATADADFAPFMEQLQKQIKANWHPPKRSKSETVVVEFTVYNNGRVGDVAVVDHKGVFRDPRVPTGGDTEMDNAAMQAVYQAAPFGKFPAGAPQSVRIRFTFEYNVLSGANKQSHTQRKQRAKSPAQGKSSTNSSTSPSKSPSKSHSTSPSESPSEQSPF